jgi:CxxC motif-containing protein (DUF1111 family)
MKITTKNYHVWGFCLLGLTTLQAQTDPGPRKGPAPPAAGIRGLTTTELAMFNQGLSTFQEVDGFANGLGPRFNLDSCAGCHAQPTVGGSSPAINPQIAVATKAGALNHIPPFLSSNGPVRVVRFKTLPNGQPDGGVHDLFVISGRNDSPAGCKITQPDFSQANNLSFRIPTPVFGLGLMEAIPDSILVANLAATAAQRAKLGIGGRFNTNGNDGTITRFGWKAQNKSPLLFAGEAYNVEQGVTNEIFPQEREEDPNCATNATPEDRSDIAKSGYSDIQNFVFFMRYLAPPPPPQGPPSPSINNGQNVFNTIGCAACHTQTISTGNSSTAALAHQPVHLCSDLALHHMGQGLADGISQGQAAGDEFRTAPLWGLGSRLFFLHDGRTADLVQAIVAHDSPGSEAHAVTLNYNALPPQAKQDLLNYLRSL